MIVRKRARDNLETYEAISAEKLNERMTKNNRAKKVSTTSNDLVPTIELLYYLHKNNEKMNIKRDE